MNNTSVRRLACLGATILAAGLFIASLKVPVWHMRMEAPQYQDEEALRVRVYPGRMAGDLREITVLNKYIGVHIPSELPQFRLLPIALIGAAALAMAGNLAPRVLRGRLLLACAVLLSLTMLWAAGLGQKQMHEIGHNRDRHTALKGVGDFTPRLLGSVKIANFRTTAGLGTGAGLIGGGIALLFGAAFLSRPINPGQTRTLTPPRGLGGHHAAAVPAL